MIYLLMPLVGLFLLHQWVDVLVAVYRLPTIKNNLQKFKLPPLRVC